MVGVARPGWAVLAAYMCRYTHAMCVTCVPPVMLGTAEGSFGVHYDMSPMARSES